jgi:N-acetylmuramoyl-L-alanine amidase
MKIFIVIFYLTIFSSASYAENIITSFRTSDNGDYSRFVIELKNKPDYKIFTLNDPFRVVIDLENTIWPDYAPLKNETHLIKEIRYSRSSTPVRIVLDTKQDIVIKKHFILASDAHDDYRLVIDIIPKNGSDKNPKYPTPVTKEGLSASIPQPKLRVTDKPLIVIDAGHGGHDPGAIGYKNTQEKDLTLSYAKTLEKLLLETGKYKVYMTRSSDIYLKLHERVNIARKVKGDLFISLHANSHNNRNISGLSIYTLSEHASDKEAEALAKKENKEGLINGIDLENNPNDLSTILIAMTQRETQNISAKFAENLIQNAQGEVKILGNPHRFAGFKVLTGADIPAVLVELGYITNKKEERLLSSKNYKNKLSQAIVKAIDSHFKDYHATEK